MDNLDDGRDRTPPLTRAASYRVRFWLRLAMYSVFPISCDNSVHFRIHRPLSGVRFRIWPRSCSNRVTPRGPRKRASLSPRGRDKALWAEAGEIQTAFLEPAFFFSSRATRTPSDLSYRTRALPRLALPLLLALAAVGFLCIFRPCFFFAL